VNTRHYASHRSQHFRCSGLDATFRRCGVQLQGRIGASAASASEPVRPQARTRRPPFRATRPLKAARRTP
jgi:hypothetical protein